MLAMVQVTQIVLTTLEEHYSKSVKGQSTSYLVINHASTQVKALVVLACLRQVALFLGELTHLEVDMGFLEEVSLLDAGLCFHY